MTQPTDIFVILPNGAIVNLAYVSNVQLGADFKVDVGAGKPTAIQKRTLYFFLAGVLQNVPSTKGATASYTYSSQNLARAARDKINTMLASVGAAVDLRAESSSVSLIALDPNTAPAGSGQIMLVNGYGIGLVGKITINNIVHPINQNSDGHFSITLDPALTGNTYDVEYTDPSGNAAVISGGLIVT